MRTKDDELLIRGLSILKELEFSHVPQEMEIDYTFSEKYIKNKEKLLNKIGHSYWKYVNTVAKKVAIIIVTLIITFSSLMTVDAFREKVIDFIFKVYNSFTQIDSFADNEQKPIERYYTIHNKVDTYYLSSTTINKYVFITFWSNKLNNDIMLTQNGISESSKFNSEHGELSEVIINSTPCLICKDPIQYYCYWEFDGYRFELIYPVDLGEEFMSEVVGHLVEVNPEDIQQ